MKRWLFRLLPAYFIAVTNLHAQEPAGVPPSPEPARKKVGLVLSGGGAKGTAHVGVLRVLEEAGIPIDYIAGTSMGALIGGLYAIGYSAAEIETLIRSQDWNALFRDRVPRIDRLVTERENADRYILSIPMSSDRRIRIPSGFVEGKNIYNLLLTHTVGYHDSIRFETLPIPFACVSYDLAAGREVVIREGILAAAIRSSISIPGVFTPVHVDSMLLVDGGVINNFPVDVVRSMGADVVIGSDVLAGIKDASQLNSLTDMITQFTGIIGRENYNANLSRTDIYIQPDIESYKSMSFSTGSIDSLMRRGEEKARSLWSEIMALKEKIGVSNDPYRPDIKHVKLSEEIRVGSITIEGVGQADERQIRKKLTLAENSIIRISDIQHNLNILSGMGIFSNVTYHLSGSTPYDLTFHLTETGRNSLNLGARFDSEEMGALLLNATLNRRAIRGLAFEMAARLSRNSYVQTDFLIGNTFLGMAGLSYRFNYNDMNFYDAGTKQGNLTFRQHGVKLSFTGLRWRNCQLRLGVQYEHFGYRDVLFSDRFRKISLTGEEFFSYYFSALWETLDSHYYPTRGMALRAHYMLNTDNFVRYRGGAPFSAVSLNFAPTVPISNRVALLPAFYGRVLIGEEIAFPHRNFFGGSVPGRYFAQQLPFIGIRDMEMAENSLFIGRLDLRVRLWSKHYVSLMGNFGLESRELSALPDGKSVIGGGLGYSFNSSVGPLVFILDYDNRSHKVGSYFSLGRYF